MGKTVLAGFWVSLALRAGILGGQQAFVEDLRNVGFVQALFLHLYLI